MDSANASEKFQFKSTYKMADYGSSRNGINWSDGHIEYRESHTFMTETVEGFAPLHIYGVFIFAFLSGLTERPIHNIQDINCPPPDAFNYKLWCNLPCHKFPKLA